MARTQAKQLKQKTRPSLRFTRYSVVYIALMFVIFELMEYFLPEFPPPTYLAVSMVLSTGLTAVVYDWRLIERELR